MRITILAITVSMVAVTAHGQALPDRVTTLESDVDAIESEQMTQAGRLDELESAPAGTPALHRYVGFSDALVAGGAGFAGMAAACQAKFGAGSRIATTLEIVSATNFPPPSPGVAWVQTQIVGFSNTSFPGLDNNVVADASGLTFRNPSEVLNCAAWTHASGPFRGLTVVGENHSIAGGMNCAIAHAVACAAP